jgi:diguanylate cyclase
MLGRRRTDEPLLPLAQAMVDKRTEALARVVGAAGAAGAAGAVSPDAAGTQKAAREAADAAFKAVDLRLVIDAALTAYAPELKRRSQRLELRLPHDTLMVSGEAERLQQALSNLLGNASKYTRNQGVITLEVVVTARELMLTVSDTGIGISAAILPKVFDPFVQDTHAIGFNGVGLGIGLTAVREVIEAHRGSVEARSAGEGLGSQFIVMLPRLNAA